MDALTSLIEGFGTALTPQNLLYAFVGVLLGTAIGVLPGIGPAMTVALLLPLTRGLDVTTALIMFAGIYYGGMYGGSTTAVLLNTPGESASVVSDRGQQDGPGRPGGAGAGHGGDRLLRGGHHRDPRSGAPGPDRRRVGRPDLPCRQVLHHGAGLHRRDLGAR